MLFDQFSTVIQGVIHGLGIALVPSFLITQELTEGQLIPVFGAAMKSPNSYFLVWPNDRPARPPLTAFCGWIKGEVQI